MPNELHMNGIIYEREREREREGDVFVHFILICKYFFV